MKANLSLIDNMKNVKKIFFMLVLTLLVNQILHNPQ